MNLWCHVGRHKWGEWFGTTWMPMPVWYVGNVDMMLRTQSCRRCGKRYLA